MTPFKKTLLSLAAACLLLAPLLAAAPPARAQSGGPIFLPVIVRTDPPPPPPGVIANPGFEYGYYGWFFSKADIITTALAHTGVRSAFLGDNTILRTAAIEQTLTVPTDKPNLRWYQYTASEEFECEDFRDRAQVLVNGVQKVEFLLCETSVTNSWVSQDLNLNAYKGQAIKLRVEFASDGSLPSVYAVDDFSFVP